MISQSIEFEGDGFVVVRFGSPVTRARVGRPRRPRARTHVVVEQGHYLSEVGLGCVEELVALEQGPRIYDQAKLDVGGSPEPWWKGGGLGRDRLSAHIVVPGQPELHRGKVVFYRLLPEQEDPARRPGLGSPLVVKVLDVLASRHASGGRAAPSPVVARGLHSLLDEFERRGLRAVGGYACGAPASPGDALEAELRARAGDTELHHLPVEDDMSAYSEALAKLRVLGFDPGPKDTWGASAFAALVAFQTMVQLVPDGVLGRITLGALRRSAPPM